MASSPFNPNEAVPADNSLASAFPAAERTFRDIIESWLLTEHGRSGHHTFPMYTTTERDGVTDWEVGSIVYNETLDKLQIVESIGPVVWIDVIDFTEPVQGTTAVAGVFEKGTTAELAAATADKAICADNLENTAGTLTDAATVAVDWDTAFWWNLTVTASRVIGNPTNGQPNTTRNIVVQGDSGSARTITFGNQYLGTLPTITDCTSSVWYLLTIYCYSSTHFAVSAKKIKG